MKQVRNTKQKQYIVNYLLENEDKHITVDDIANTLKSTVGKSTIYRVLNDLEEKGEVSRIAREDNKGFFYKYNKKCEKHHRCYHLICESCGKLKHYSSSDIDSIFEKVSNDEKFDVNFERVTFFGKCKKCQNK